MKPPVLPSVVDTGQLINASQSDWRAILIFAMFLFAGMFLLLVYGAFVMGGLRKAIDKVADSLWALKLAMANERAAQDKELVAVKHEREMANEERAWSRTERERVGGREDDVRKDERDV